MKGNWFRTLTAGLGVVALTFATTASSPQAATGTMDMVVIEQPPATANGSSSPSYQVVTPTPGTGSVVVVQPPQGSGPGSSGPQYQVVIPGPNPAQNTDVGLAEQTQSGAAPGTHVTVQSVPPQ